MNPITNHGSVVFNKIKGSDYCIETLLSRSIKYCFVLSSTFHILSLCCVESLPFD